MRRCHFPKCPDSWLTIRSGQALATEHAGYYSLHGKYWSGEGLSSKGIERSLPAFAVQTAATFRRRQTENHIEAIALLLEVAKKIGVIVFIWLSV